MVLKDVIYNSTKFDISFLDKINILLDNSGTGKTFLINMVSSYCENNDIPYMHIDYKHRELVDNKKSLYNKEILLFDKADLYLTPDLFEELKSVKGISIISIKDIADLYIDNNVGLYNLINTGSNIKTNRWG